MRGTCRAGEAHGADSYMIFCLVYLKEKAVFVLQMMSGKGSCELDRRWF